MILYPVFSSGKVFKDMFYKKMNFLWLIRDFHWKSITFDKNEK